MANSLLKLTVESSEYDAKLKKAAEGIRHLADVAHKGDGDLTGLEKSTLDYIKSVGEMETKSRSAAGQVRELESTYKELKVVYDQLNEVEKADEGGKALAASLEQLKQRAQEARAQLDSASKSLQENADAGKEDSSVLEKLASKFTVNIDALKLFDIGLQAAKAALDVAKDAFFASEATVDEWGRTMQSSQALYEGFLNSINNGDISGYLSRMDDIVKAAREAYNALDTLQTMKTIQGPGMSKQQTENDRIRQMIQTGRYIAPVDGRKNAVWNGQEMKNGQVLAPEQIRILERQLQGGLQKMTGFVKNEVDQTGKAIDAYYNSLAKQNGMSLSEFKKGTSTWEEFRQKIRGYEEYKKWDTQARTEFARQGGRGNVDFDKNNPFAEFKKWGTFRVDKMGENSFNELVGLIKQRDQQSSQIYSTMAQSYRTMNRAEGLTVRQIMGGGSGGSGGGSGKSTTTTGIKDEFTGMEELVGLIPVAEQKVKDLQQQIRESWDEGEIEKLRDDLKLAQAELDRLNGKAQNIDLNKMFPERGVSDGASQSFGQQIAQSINVAMAEAAQNADIQTLRTLLETQIKNGIEGVDIPADWITDQIFGEGMDIPDETWQALQDQINAKLAEMEIDPINIDFKTGESSKEEKKEPKELNEFKEFNQKAGQFISGLQSVSSGLKGLGIQLPAGVDQLISAMSSVMQILQGVQSIISVFSTGAMAANTAAIIANTIALTTNSAMQIIPFARGGIVPHAANGYYIPGNSFSGDTTPILANAGELVLNKAQQGNLASQLSDGGLGNLYLETRVDAEELIIMLNNNGMRRGLGKLING